MSQTAAPEILTYVDRDGDRFIAVWFPPDWTSEFRESPDMEEDGSYELVPDAPYWWRTSAVDRSAECAS
jgi:hypothetical protein